MEELAKNVQVLAQRVEKIETGIFEIKAINNSLAQSLEKHSDAMLTLGQHISTAIQIQGNSLSVPLLKDILVPMVMKLFTFFSFIVVLLLTTFLGIRWAFSDLFRFISG